MPSAAQVLALFPADKLRLSADGRIIDFLDPEVVRPNTPEERVRQEYARKLHYDFGYPKELMVFGAAIDIGSETKFADIAVYENISAARRKDQSRIRIVVETKAPDVKKGVAQLTSYILASSAQGGVWINETDAPKYFHRAERNLIEWPNIPRVNEEWDAIGRHKKEHLRPPHDLVETFKRCHNALYKVGIDSEDLAMDMVRIILAKYQDESEEGDTCEFRCTPSELRTAEGRRRVADRVRALFVKVRDNHRDVFDRHEDITAGHREVATVVSELQDFRFISDEDSEEVYDIVGAAYEVYVGSHLKGDRGQYFTHRLMVQLLVRLVDPSETDVIVDPAMGSGGFLIAAMRHVTQKIMRSNRSGRTKRLAVDGLHRRIFGIDKSPKLVKVARTNMILASDGHSGLVHGDSLEPLDRLREDFVLNAGPGLATVILTNPPFGATAEHKITADKEPEILEQFDLGKVWKRVDGALKPTEALAAEGAPPEYLFVERTIRWVRPGGKIGIVLPRGVLDNDRALPVRTFILRETRVLAVVNCHDDTFKPHTDAKAALLVLEKKTQDRTREDDYRIFMAVSQGIGHNGVGEPIFKTDATGNTVIEDGEPVLDHDCDDIYRAWLEFSSGRELNAGFYFSIARDEITASLNLNPVRYLPEYTASRKRVLEIGEREGWKVERLGQIAQVFGGPRLKRPYADRGVTDGPQIVRFFTGNAVTQTRGENIKYLDLAKARPAQKKMIEQMYLRRGMLLITRSGTVGRVVYATNYHDGAVGTEDVIRVVIGDDALRGYVYQFLLSKLGQDQLRANIYGAIVDHIEARHVKEVLVPVPTDASVVEAIGGPVTRSIQLQEEAHEELEKSREELEDSIREDIIDAAIAQKILDEISDNPGVLIQDEELDNRLRDLLTL